MLARLHAILGAKFVDMFNGAKMDIVRQEWGAALADFKPIELERGLAELARRRFIPTLGEFTNFCRPALDPEWAYREAERGLRQRDTGAVGEWSHPAVWRAASTLSPDVRAGNYKACASRWAFTLKAELAAGWGAAVPEPLLAIPNHTGTRPPTDAERQSIRKALGKE